MVICHVRMLFLLFLVPKNKKSHNHTHISLSLCVFLGFMNLTPSIGVEKGAKNYRASDERPNNYDKNLY